MAQLMKWSTIGSCLYSREAIHKSMIFHVKFPANIIQLIPTRRKLIVILEDKQIRYLVKRKNKFKLFSYNT